MLWGFVVRDAGGSGGTAGINPGGIPQIAADLEVLAKNARTLVRKGAAFGATGSQVHATWQGLAGFYHAPEAWQLLAATGPVAHTAGQVGSDFEAAGQALQRYVEDLRPVKTRLAQLQRQAEAFQQRIVGFEGSVTHVPPGATTAQLTTEHTSDWHTDQDLVTENNHLISAVTAAVAEWQAAQRRCANAITALYEGPKWTAADGDGCRGPHEFGATKQVWQTAAETGVALPWGQAQEHDRGFFDHLWAQACGFGTAAKDSLTGLAGLVGWAPDAGFGWDTLGRTWRGIGLLTLATNPATIGVTAANTYTDLPGLPKGTLPGIVTETGKTAVAYRYWDTDTDRALGRTLFTGVTAAAGPKGAGLTARALPRVAQVVARLPRDQPGPGNLPDPANDTGEIPTLGTHTDASPDLSHLQDDAASTGHRDPPHYDRAGSNRPQNPYTGDLIKVRKPDAHADRLADKLGGESRVRFANDPDEREFDAVSDDYIGETKTSVSQVGKGFRSQARHIFEAAYATDRSVYFHFSTRPPDSVVAVLEKYSRRYHVHLVIDHAPLHK